MSALDFVPFKFTQPTFHPAIETLLKLATVSNNSFFTNVGGFLFGSVVREHIVPSFLGQPTTWDPKINDIDIWFSSNLELSNFLSSVEALSSTGFQLELISEFDNRIDSKESKLEIVEEDWSQFYLKSRKSYNFIYEGEKLVKLDLVTSKMFCAFDVNICSLTFRYTKKGLLWAYSKNGVSVGYNNLINYFRSISEKTAKITREYTNLLKRDIENPTPIFRYRVDRLINKYIRRNWTLVNLQLIDMKPFAPSEEIKEITDSDRIKFVQGILGKKFKSAN